MNATRSGAGGMLRGAAAGAAGTTALNAVTYLDMALRGRPASSTPEETVERLTEVAGVPVPGGSGPDGTRAHRVSALGALTGMATGVAVGAALGAVAGAAGRRPGLLGGGLAAALVAMAGSSGPMAALGVTDPRTWSRADWVSDAVPHAAYGAVTAWVLRRL
ncbi:hypothetical protein RM780_09220 [Streptomyces sp. DSM 44917]|uniref:Uncharacterized protein n=1 Tax=Streptomyces boetiae TaxID=3075541 RepID=A0ABU2L6F7_9ACTN|nr:hypothetical protein [Streptomyces sp. DSM 44917]MDT0307141.1 hypothetical protein [Streptomyces sp. DSM 44917]